MIYDSQNIIENLKQKDKTAFEWIFKRLYRELFLFADSFVYDKNSAKDIVQDAFLALLDNVNRMTNLSEVRGFLYLSVKNNSINYLKHYKVVLDSKTEIAEHYLFEQKREYDFKRDSRLKMIENILEKLPDQQSKIIAMRINGMDYISIAEKLNISVQTVNVHIKRAYKYIRENINIELLVFLLILVPDILG